MTREFRVTFFADGPRRGGWVTIAALSYEHARRTAFALFDRQWVSVYGESDFEDMDEFFPRGELGRVNADDPNLTVTETKVT